MWLQNSSKAYIYKTWFDILRRAEGSENPQAADLCSIFCSTRDVSVRHRAYICVDSWSNDLFEDLVRAHGQKKRALLDHEWVELESRKL